MLTCANSLQSALLSVSALSRATCSVSGSRGAGGFGGSSLSPLSTLSSSASTLLPVLASFLLCPGSVDEADGVITNISLIQTWRWFFALTRFEAVFLGMCMLQICILQYLGILPLNINNYIYSQIGTKRKRRRRRTTSIEELLNDYEKNLDLGNNFLETDLEFGPKLIEKMLGTLHQMDQQKCTLRTLCELQNWRLRNKLKSQPFPKNESKAAVLPRSLELTLSVLSINHRKRKEAFEGRRSILPMKGPGSPSGARIVHNTTHTLTQLYEDAIEYGRLTSDLSAADYTYADLASTNSWTNSTSTATTATNYCTKFYGECELSIDEILEYISQMHFDEIF